MASTAATAAGMPISRAATSAAPIRLVAASRLMDAVAMDLPVLDRAFVSSGRAEVGVGEDWRVFVLVPAALIA